MWEEWSRLIEIFVGRTLISSFSIILTRDLKEVFNFALWGSVATIRNFKFGINSHFVRGAM